MVLRFESSSCVSSPQLPSPLTALQSVSLLDEHRQDQNHQEQDHQELAASRLYLSPSRTIKTPASDSEQDHHTHLSLAEQDVSWSKSTLSPSYGVGGGGGALSPSLAITTPLSHGQPRGGRGGGGRGREGRSGSEKVLEEDGKASEGEPLSPSLSLMGALGSPGGARGAGAGDVGLGSNTRMPSLSQVLTAYIVGLFCVYTRPLLTLVRECRRCPRC